MEARDRFRAALEHRESDRVEQLGLPVAANILALFDAAREIGHH